MQFPCHYVHLRTQPRDLDVSTIPTISTRSVTDMYKAYDTYQSDGNCSDDCGGYAFAITQGNDCWCSDYAPGSTVDLSSCNSPCPGYPYEDCGSSSGLFGYVALGKSPAGTMGAATSTQATTTKAAPTTSQAVCTVTFLILYRLCASPLRYVSVLS